MIEVGHHPILNVGNLAVHKDTVVSMLIVSAVLIISTLIVHFTLLRASKNIKNPPKALVAIESCFEGVQGIVTGVMGEKGVAYSPFIITLFVFILFSNLLGLIPINAFYSLFFEKTFGHIPEIIAPTADINTTAALALIVFFAVHFFGTLDKGFKYLLKFLQPNPLFLPLNIMEELAKPFSLAIRLFGNTFGKETIILILISLTAFPIIYPVPILALGLFIAFVQAYIFTLLATFYLSAALSEGH